MFIVGYNLLATGNYALTVGTGGVFFKVGDLSRFLVDLSFWVVFDGLMTFTIVPLPFEAVVDQQGTQYERRQDFF
jgi:hypothetical protein